MNTKKNIKLSICIPTYNRPIHLENCLEAIYISKKIVKVSNLRFVFLTMDLSIISNLLSKNIKKN